MMLALAFILLVLLFILPFLPGARESRRKEDAEPLYINMEYCKDPRYFAFSFRKLFVDSLKEAGDAEGFRELMLSKKETVQLVRNALFAEGTVVENVLYVIEHLGSENNVTFNKEVYVRGSARIGENNHLQALACDGDIHLAKGARFFRWLDAEGAIIAEEQCALGIDATCGGALTLASGCSFMRLYGFPIAIGASPEETAEPQSMNLTVFEGDATERDLSEVPPGSRKDCSIITVNSLSIGDNSIVRGHVKTHGKLIIGTHVVIAGNIFAEGDIEIGPHSTVLGTVFSQEHVRVKEGVQIGAKDRIKSVIGKKGVILESGARIYGHVMTEGKGLVL